MSFDSHRRNRALCREWQASGRVPKRALADRTPAEFAATCSAGKDGWNHNEEEPALNQVV